ncbi:MAG: hypothetical protein IT319_19080, partial [Anaerolineae bacterium]|nr:hypothetical protein [Anaerolineae bacterium]
AGTISSAPPNPSLLAANPCALPCFFGVTPGSTTRAQATALLSKTVGITLVSDTLLTFPLVDSSGQSALVSIVNDAEGLVESVRIIAIGTDTNLAQFGDLLLTGQTPVQVFRTCADMDTVRFLMTFGAGETLLLELFPQGKLTPSTPITLVDIARPNQRSLTDARSSFGCSVETHWYGFAPLWKYFQPQFL